MLSAPASPILRTLFEIEQTQWWPAERIAEHQLRQAFNVVRFAQRTLPYYKQLPIDGNASGRLPASLDEFRSLPILRRAEVQAAGEKLHSASYPSRHGRKGATLTSGSCGQPVQALSTGVTRLLWRLFTLRDHVWHRRDLSLGLAVIRDCEPGAAPAPDGKRVTRLWPRATAKRRES
jgi:phenylacetate-CoA ligase